MRSRFAITLATVLFCVAAPHSAWSFASIFCGQHADGTYACIAATERSTPGDAAIAASAACFAEHLTNCRNVNVPAFDNSCYSVAAPPLRNEWNGAAGATAYQAQESAKSYCSSARGGISCITLVTACEHIAQSPPQNLQTAPAQNETAAPVQDQIPDGQAIAAAIAASFAELNREVWYAAICLDVLLFFILLIPLRRSPNRVGMLGALTYACVILSIGLSYIPQSFFSAIPDGYFFFISTVCLQRAARVGISAAGIPFVTLLVWNYFFDKTLPTVLPRSSKHIEVLVARSQRRTWLRRVVFMLDVRMGVSAEQFDLMRKYRLGRTIVYDSLRRQRQNELARTHLEMARERKSKTICLWREEVRGFFRRIWYLFRALLSFLIGFLFIRITIGKLVRGAHIESKSLDRILEAKNAIENGASDLLAYLIAAETFDGREDLFEPA